MYADNRVFQGYRWDSGRSDCPMIRGTVTYHQRYWWSRPSRRLFHTLRLDAISGSEMETIPNATRGDEIWRYQIIAQYIAITGNVSFDRLPGSSGWETSVSAPQGMGNCVANFKMRKDTERREKSVRYLNPVRQVERRLYPPPVRQTASTASR